jgi:hypothetical protein
MMYLKTMDLDGTWGEIRLYDDAGKRLGTITQDGTVTSAPSKPRRKLKAKAKTKDVAELERLFRLEDPRR